MKNKRFLTALCLSIFLTIGMIFTGCGNSKSTVDVDSEQPKTESTTENSTDILQNNQEEQLPLQMIDDNYRTFYEVFVYSFYDSNQDGIGDFDGLTQKLDYINDGDDLTDTDMGFNGIWLMPIMTSTTYHKYDVVDYYTIDPEYGTLDDFKEFMEACNERGINVILDMVINHTSSQHIWFQTACDYLKNLGDETPNIEECPYIEYYNFSKEKNATTNCNVEGTDWYYEGRFWSEMPDLNLGNEKVRVELENIAKFWLDLGVSGFRLDAAKEFYSGNDTANIEVLSWYNQMVKSYQSDAYIVAEIWTDVNTYAKYYESGIDSIFDFAFANSDGIIANAVKGTSKNIDASTYGSSVAALDEKFSEYNEDYIDAPFYTNHDMARSAGYYSGEDRESQTKLAGALNLFMSGSTFVYYGEEIGMKGSGKDENKRAPMQWLIDMSATGMCDGPQGMDKIKMINKSLEEQLLNPYSIYEYYKNAVEIRNQNPEIARGTTEFLEALSDQSICVLKKTYNNKEILIVYNVSTEDATIDLSTTMLNSNLINSNDSTIKGKLMVNEKQPTLIEGQLILPEYGTVVIW